MELSDLAVTIGNHQFAHSIMNAAGHIKRDEDFQKILRSESSGIVIGSIMPQGRSGNEGQVYVPGKISVGPLKGRNEPFALNSLGIPCQALEYYKKYLPLWVKQAADVGKPLILSIAGFTFEDYALGTRLAIDTGVPIVEINFGCSNLEQHGKQKPIFSYDSRRMTSILHDLALHRADFDTWIKFSPLDPTSIKRMAKIINEFPTVKAVVTTNAWPNAMDFDQNDRPLITSNKGRAGLSGPVMRPIGLGQVSMWREELDKVGWPNKQAVIGVGGISKGEHIFQYQEAGATAVQVGTAYFDEGENIFSRLLMEIDEILEARNNQGGRNG